MDIAIETRRRAPSSVVPSPESGLAPQAGETIGIETPRLIRPTFLLDES